MKLFTLCFAMCLMSFSWISSQNLYSGEAEFKVVYSYSVDRSHLEPNQNKVREDFKIIIEEGQRLVAKMKGNLIFNNRASIYTSPEGLPPPNMEHGVANGLVRSDHKFYYYRDDGIFVTENLSFGRRQLSLDDREMIWNILPEKAIINGIECQKAEGIFKTPGFTDTVVEVWFAPEIPFPYGPMDAYGLPGLILKYKWGVLEIEATQITRITDGSVELIIPNFGDIPVLSRSIGI